MTTIEGTCRFDYAIDLNINKFEEIDEDHMSIDKSDELIREAISKKYGIDVDKIWVKYPDKK